MSQNVSQEEPNLTCECWLIRHGESIGNRQDRYQGQMDSPLSKLGQKQAATLAQRLKIIHQRSPFHALYASDLSRATDTAKPISARLGIPMQIRTSLREIDVGQWGGLTYTQIEERFPEEWRLSFHQIDPELERGGGESYAQAQQRIVAEVAALSQRHPGQRVLVCFHGAVIRALLAHILGIPLANLRRMQVDNTSIQRVFLRPSSEDGLSGTVLSVNDAAHLEGWSKVSAVQHQVE